MKNRTVYEVLDDVMQDYAYSIKKERNRVEITGSVVIKKIGITVTHEKTVIFPEENSVRAYRDGLERVIGIFKEELRSKVADVINEHKKELTNDDVLIERLLNEVSSLKEKLDETEAVLNAARDRVRELELEKVNWPYTPSGIPWTTSPWSTGITWDPSRQFDPNVVTPTITCEANDASNSSVTTEDGFKKNRGTVHLTADNGKSADGRVLKSDVLKAYFEEEDKKDKLYGELNHLPKGNWWEQIE